MNTEIERKFLVKSDDYLRLATSHSTICQGYLSVDKGRTIRIRQRGEKAYMTIKAAPEPGHFEHFEWEKEITLDDFNALFPLCLPGVIRKERYLVPLGELTIEVDVFKDLNEGLVMAEIELPSEDTPITLPDFLGEEVTRDPRYYNSYITQRPYTLW